MPRGSAWSRSTATRSAPASTCARTRPSTGAGEVDWWIASDLGELATGQALRTDHVLGVGGASTTLAQVTVRDERDHVLDLGTGCGIQALHASRHSRRVVGTDISRRALAFARFNAALAGLDVASSICARGRCSNPSPTSGSTSS